jgi:hypothetical protein
MAEVWQQPPADDGNAVTATGNGRVMTVAIAAVRAAVLATTAMRVMTMATAAAEAREVAAKTAAVRATRY